MADGGVHVNCEEFSLTSEAEPLQPMQPLVGFLVQQSRERDPERWVCELARQPKEAAVVNSEDIAQPQWKVKQADADPEQRRIEEDIQETRVLNSSVPVEAIVRLEGHIERLLAKYHDELIWNVRLMNQALGNLNSYVQTSKPEYKSCPGEAADYNMRHPKRSSTATRLSGAGRIETSSTASKVLKQTSTESFKVLKQTSTESGKEDDVLQASSTGSYIKAQASKQRSSANKREKSGKSSTAKRSGRSQQLLSYVIAQPKESQMLCLAMGRSSAQSVDLLTDLPGRLQEQQWPNMRTSRCFGTKDLDHVLHSPVFELAMGLTVITNAVFIGYEVDYMSAHPEEIDYPVHFIIVSHVFTILFTVELFLRLLCGIGKFFWASDGKILFWNYLDVVIVGASLLEITLDLLTYNGSHAEQFDLSSLRILRTVRFIRLVRLLRVARFVRFVRALRTLVYSILCTLKSVVWSLVLLATIIYVFAILFTQVASSHRSFSMLELSTPEIPNLDRYWGALGTSMLSLFMSVVDGISWVEVIKPLRSLGTFWPYAFLAYISFTYFAVLNVVTGVFCHSAIESNSEDKFSMLQTVMRHKQMFTDRFIEIFNEMDQEDSGRITIHQFLSRMQEEDVKNYFESLELSCTDALCLFDIFDEALSDGILVDEFVLGCLRLKGPARSSDMIRLLHETQKMSARMIQILHHFNISSESAATVKTAEALLRELPREQTIDHMITTKLLRGRTFYVPESNSGVSDQKPTIATCEMSDQKPAFATYEARNDGNPADMCPDSSRT